MQVVVVGGGIGGLATALALRRHAIDVTVYERHSYATELGAGLSLWPNAVHVLRRLGLESFLGEHGVAQLGGSIRSVDGTVIGRSSSEELQRRFGAPAVAVHRAELLGALAEAVGNDNIVYNAELERFTQDRDDVTAVFVDGRRAQGDALIGADGIYSVVRSQLFGSQPPRYAGYTAWRGVCAFADEQLLQVASGEIWGCGRRFGIVPMSGGRVYWFATDNAPPLRPVAGSSHKAEAATLFADWPAPIPALIAATPDDAVLRNDIHDRVPLTSWSEGRVTLLGDAAHPMTPNLGQGGCQALEDALTLATCLHAQPDNVPDALQQYDQRRISRTSTIVLQSRRLGQLGQMTNPLACRLRNNLLRLVPPQAQLRQLAWILGYEVN